MAKLHQSHIQQGKKSENDADICPICNKSLYLNEEYTQRVGLLDEDDVCVGWMCPHCEAMFDNDGKLTGLKGYTGMGEA
jgi:uncharacterized protein with PIN domain